MMKCDYFTVTDDEVYLYLNLFIYIWLYIRCFYISNDYPFLIKSIFWYIFFLISLDLTHGH